MIFVYLRFFFAYLWLLIGCVLCLPITFLRPFNHRNTVLCARLICPLSLKILGIKIVIENPKDLDSIKSSLLICNHQENLDIFVVSSVVPSGTVSLGKKSLVYIPFFGALYALTGNILIERGNKRKAYKSLEKARNFIKRTQGNIVIMPEGTRSRGRGLLPFKKGPFYTAIHSKIDIAPLIVSDYKHLNFKKIFSGTVYIRALAPILIKDFDESQIEALKDKSYQVMHQALIDQDQKFN